MHNGELQSSTSCLKPWYMQANGLTLPVHNKVADYNRYSSGMRIDSDWHGNSEQVLEHINLFKEWGCKVEDVLERIAFAEADKDIDDSLIELGNRANRKLAVYTRWLNQRLRKELQSCPLEYITTADFSYECAVGFSASGFKVNVGRYESPAIVNLDLSLIKEELREPAKALITHLSASSICADIWTVASQADYVVTEIMDESNPGELKVLISELENSISTKKKPTIPDWLIEMVNNYYSDDVETFLKDENYLSEIISRLEAACVCFKLANNGPAEVTDYKETCKEIIELSLGCGSLSDIEQSILNVARLCFKDPFLGVDYEPIEYDGDALLGSGRVVIFATDETTEEFCDGLFSYHSDSEESNGSIDLTKNGLDVYEAIVKSEYCLAVIAHAFVNC